MPLTDEQREWLALTLTPGVGTTLFVRLLARFGAPGSVLRASEAALVEVVGERLAQRIRNYKQAVDVESQEQALAKYQVRFVSLDDSLYPTRLAEIYDPPLALFIRGELYESDQHCVAVVGTRKATAYGLRMAERLGGELAARGIAVVSGMAQGIDAAAHRGALEAGGRTIAVLGSGVDIVFPAEHTDLMQQIIKQGCVLSPFPMGMKPLKGNFPQRNRIISGISLGTVVVEAPPGSGSLITARHAAEQGREVYAVPGQVGQRNSMGPHSLIREGAKLVETVEDILVELEVPASARQPMRSVQPEQTQVPEPAPQPIAAPTAATRVEAAPAVQSKPPAPMPPISPTEKDVLSVLSPDGSFVDEIAMACRISVSEALSSLTMLELKGLVRQFSGKRFAPR
ncbi:MAG TPA: DNA-protecting protein DprA [Candidatus Hydrogenedentes bacterium]|nr:DNA-protecting protein DprA [Candidatus Hydrogenedentota bacterium]